MPENLHVCPISHTHVDERVARLNGLVTLLFVVGGVYIPLLWLLIAIDFIFRSFKIKWSPVARINKLIVTALHLEPIPIDAAPKKFAARMGLGMSVGLLALSYFELQTALNVLLTLFAVAISLEAFFNYCVGCKIYSLMIQFGLISIPESPQMESTDEEKSD